MAEVLHVKERESLGKLNNKRLRAAGAIPAVLYGHGAKNINLAIPHEEFEAAMRHGAKVVDLAGAAKDSALISDIQWDTFGQEALHVDLIRVSKDQRIEVTVPIEVRGVAPGVSEGGTLQVALHELQIECPAASIPEKLEANVGELGVGDSLAASAVELPENVTLVTDAEATVVQCIEVVETEEEEESVEAAATAEPEVIGKPAEEGEEASE